MPTGEYAKAEIFGGKLPQRAGRFIGKTFCFLSCLAHPKEAIYPLQPEQIAKLLSRLIRPAQHLTDSGKHQGIIPVSAQQNVAATEAKCQRIRCRLGAAVFNFQFSMG